MEYETRRGTVNAVNEVSMKVGKKEIVGLVGESGCGKTTLALSILRLVSPPGKIVKGEILWNGRNLLDLPDKEMRKIRGDSISMVFQDPMTYLNPVMKIGSQVTEILTVKRKVSKSEVHEKAIELLELTQIPSPEKVVDYYPHQLSGGMLQRALTAMTFSCHPSLLICDEPTTALDVTVQAQMLEQLKSLSKRFETALLLITHDLGVISELCDRVYVMYAGEIVEYTDIFTLFEEPLHPYTSGLLRCALSIDTFKEKLETILGDVPDLINPPSGCNFHPRCPMAKEICAKETPPMTHFKEGRGVSCWLYNEPG